MRGRMTHRAVLERNTATTADAWGQPPEPSFTAQEEGRPLACYAWSKSRKVVADGEKVVTVQDLRAIFPRGADVQEGDRLQSVTDRRRSVVFPGPLTVRTVVAKATHQEATLERV
jgi:hypothetical protein